MPTTLFVFGNFDSKKVREILMHIGFPIDPSENPLPTSVIRIRVSNLEKLTCGTYYDDLLNMPGVIGTAVVDMHPESDTTSTLVTYELEDISNCREGGVCINIERCWCFHNGLR